MSDAKKIITVFGSTGSQGGSLVRALLKRGTFAIRACTRNPDSSRAVELRKAGCDVVKASYQDDASLAAALEGAYGAFFITSFWDQPERSVAAEVAVGAAVGRAAKAAGVQHLVYSSLESPAAMGAGFAFPPFDAKIGVEQALAYSGVPLTAVQVAWYFNNLENRNDNPHTGFYYWPRDETGAYVIDIPTASPGLHGIHNEDTGECFATIFERPGEFIGRKVALSGELLSGEGMCAVFAKHFPEHRFVYVNTPLDEYRAKTESSGFGDAFFRMYSWYQFRTPAGGDVALTRDLNPGALSFDAYVTSHRHRYHFETVEQECVRKYFALLDEGPDSEEAFLPLLDVGVKYVLGADGAGGFEGRDGFKAWWATTNAKFSKEGRSHEVVDAAYESDEAGMTTATLTVRFKATKVSDGAPIVHDHHMVLRLRQQGGAAVIVEKRVLG